MSKLNKKNFAVGLETMFHQTLFEDNLKDNPSHLDKNAGKPAAAKTTKKPAIKSFADNLELFLNEAIEESVQEKTEDIRAANNAVDGLKDANKRNNRKPTIGLDLLIRSTIEDASFVENDKKRMTFTFDKDKVEKLRQIADLEKQRIRDIIDELVTQFIGKYNVS